MAFSLFSTWRRVGRRLCAPESQQVKKCVLPVGECFQLLNAWSNTWRMTRPPPQGTSPQTHELVRFIRNLTGLIVSMESIVALSMGTAGRALNRRGGLSLEWKDAWGLTRCASVGAGHSRQRAWGNCFLSQHYRHWEPKIDWWSWSINCTFGRCDWELESVVKEVRPCFMDSGKQLESFCRGISISL